MKGSSEQEKAEGDPAPRRGRGAVRNVRGRFEPYETVPFDDGWGSLERARSRLQTVVTPEPCRTILTRNDSPDVPFEQSINPYKGCEHGCVYCFARPTHAYLDLSPGLDFETRIFSKPDAPLLLRRELSKPGYRCTPIALGTNTDPYQPVERELRITRGILELLCELRHPFTIVTKSNLVLRDLDLIAPAAEREQVAVYLSVTTLDRSLAQRMEPRAATPERRLEAVAGLSRAGVPTGVMAAPMIPGINDAELEQILERAAGAGATSAGYILLRLPYEVRPLFTEWLEAHYPGKAGKVLSLLGDMRGGRLNDPRFMERMRGQGPHADLLQQRFNVTCRRLNLNRNPTSLDCSTFSPPAPQTNQQPSLPF